MPVHEDVGGRSSISLDDFLDQNVVAADERLRGTESGTFDEVSEMMVQPLVMVLPATLGDSGVVVVDPDHLRARATAAPLRSTRRAPWAGRSCTHRRTAWRWL